MQIVFFIIFALAVGCLFASILVKNNKKNEEGDKINPELSIKTQQINDQERELDLREKELELMKREEQIKKRFIELKKRGIETDVDYIIVNDMDKKDPGSEQ